MSFHVLFGRHDYGAVANHAGEVRSMDYAINDHATGDGAHAGNAEDLADLGLASTFLGAVARQQPFEGFADIGDHVVDDAVESNVYAGGFGPALSANVAS